MICPRDIQVWLWCSRKYVVRISSENIIFLHSCKFNLPIIFYMLIFIQFIFTASFFFLLSSFAPILSITFFFSAVAQCRVHPVRNVIFFDWKSADFLSLSWCVCVYTMLILVFATRALNSLECWVVVVVYVYCCTPRMFECIFITKHIWEWW